jgi:serine/threonine protein kinase
VRDPGGDLSAGYETDTPRMSQPLTKMAASATAGEAGVDAVGYNDYRGTKVVGSWVWLADYHIGIATEMDVAEAYLPLKRLRLAIRILIGVILAYYIVALVFTFSSRKIRRRMRKAEQSVAVLGQYQLIDKVGEGGMGSVYKAEHAMLKRPTALKMIRSDIANAELLKRFEREVQLTAQLSHPNTIAIYDYGRTNDDVFYYAMELLDGMSLKELVAVDGLQSPGRVIHIIRQICGSLHEAHELGFVHRDIKPANIMICRRGGASDVVKVLDFGLVKSLDTDTDLELTAANVITGTPLYLSPEAIESPKELDGRSDLYAVGAVAYFLLTGKHIFQPRNVHDLMRMHVNEMPKRPSERCGRTIPSDLENIIMQCLAKKKEDRPCSAGALQEILSLCQDAGSWTSAGLIQPPTWRRRSSTMVRRLMSKISLPAVSSRKSSFDRARTSTPPLERTVAVRGISESRAISPK